MNEVAMEMVLARVQENLTAERDLLDRARAMYGPVNGEVQEVVNRISTPRIFQYEEALFRFGSKHVTQPGNALAIAYLEGKLQKWGYEPELQWFDARGVQSANVVVRIPGSVSPEVVYAVSAHFDSNARSPGADDNTSAKADMASTVVDVSQGNNSPLADADGPRRGVEARACAGARRHQLEPGGRR